MERNTENVNISLENAMKILTELTLRKKLKLRKLISVLRNHPTRNGSTVNVA